MNGQWAIATLITIPQASPFLKVCNKMMRDKITEVGRPVISIQTLLECPQQDWEWG